MHRKLQLGKLNPSELYDLIQSYKTCVSIIRKINDSSLENTKLSMPDDVERMEAFHQHLEGVYDMDVLKDTTSYKSLQQNLFVPGIDAGLDEICEHLGGVDAQLEKIRKRLCNILERSNAKNDKLVSLKTLKKGSTLFRAPVIGGAILKYYQKTIKNAIRTSDLSEDEAINELKIIHYKDMTDLIKRELHVITDADIIEWATKKDIESDETVPPKGDTYLKPDDIKLILSLNFRTNKSNVNITTDEINGEEQSADEYLEQLVSMMHSRSQALLHDHFEEYADIVEEFTRFSAELDVLQSNVCCAIKYQYYKPTVLDFGNGEPSFMNIKGFRHPIVERVQEDVEYVKNDIKIGRESLDDTNFTGVLLCGQNNGGKSCCEKAIALNLVLAQAGCYVAADEFIYRPFRNIITRLDAMDNMWRGQGSFAVEMSELRTVVNQSGPNTLVLGDEICRGTEQDSGIPIIAATIEWLCNNNVNFVFSTHFHDLINIEEISMLENLGVYHLKAYPHPDTDAIVYEYKLTPGVGSTIFGIEVARSMGYNAEICDRALYFRNKRLQKKEHLVSTKKSRYDSDIYMGKCSVCDDDAVDTHHEQQQHTADEFGAVGHFHKNAKHNLFPLCKKHHRLADQKKIQFKYQMTSNGVQLSIVEK